MKKEKKKKKKRDYDHQIAVAYWLNDDHGEH